MTEKVVLVTINVHEKPEFIRKHIDNIKTRLCCKCIVLLNTNDAMKSALAHTDLEQYCNPVPITKERFHGSLLQGICENIKHAIKSSLQFDYVLVLSSRSFFRYNTNLQDLEASLGRLEPPSCPFARWSSSKTSAVYECDTIDAWHWKAFKSTVIGQKYDALVGGPHEGLFFPKEACTHLCDLDPEIFSTEMCVEEFVIQTVLKNKNIPFSQCSEWSEEHPQNLQLPIEKIVR